MTNDDQRSPSRDGGGTNPRMIAAIVAAVLFVWFIIANSQEVDVTWWVFDTQTSLIVVILLSALLGAGITFFLMRRHNRRDQP